MDRFRCKYCGYEFMEDRYSVVDDSCPECGQGGLWLIDEGQEDKEVSGGE